MTQEYFTHLSKEGKLNNKAIVDSLLKIKSAKDFLFVLNNVLDEKEEDKQYIIHF